MRQKRFDFGRAQNFRMLKTMEADKAFDPEQVGFLRFIRHASQAYKSPNFVQKTGWLCWYWGGDIHIHSSLSTVFIYSIAR